MESRIQELNDIIEALDALGKHDCGVASYEYNKAVEELSLLENIKNWKRKQEL